MRTAFLIVLVILGIAGHTAGQDTPESEKPNADVERTAPPASDQNPTEVEDKKEDSEGESTWKWVLGLIFTAIASPLILKVLEKKLTGDPLKDQTGRLKDLIEVAALRKSHGLPEDPRIRGLIDEQTDQLAGHSTGRQEAIDTATSGLIADLSVRLCEALFRSCQQLELLQDTQHGSNENQAALDVTRLELLRSAHAVGGMGIPPRFQSISAENLDEYITYLGKNGTPVGSFAVQHASELGTTPESVQAFVNQIRETVRNPSVDTKAARILRGEQSE